MNFYAVIWASEFESWTIATSIDTAPADQPHKSPEFVDIVTDTPSCDKLR